MQFLVVWPPDSPEKRIEAQFQITVWGIRLARTVIYDEQSQL
ncbi:unnamed protein product, partial [Didymodactylos carnosus]